MIDAVSKRLARLLMRVWLVAALVSIAAGVTAQDDVDIHPSYVGSETCAECHQGETDAWSQSHHAKAWMPPGPDTILADFDGTTFEHDGTLTRFATDGRTYRILVREKDGKTSEYTVHSVAGIVPLQQYLIETEEGRLQSFDVVWDVDQERWYHLYPDQDLPPQDGLHWTGAYKNWNARCAECHATGYEKNYDAETRRYSSLQAEIGVGCEACHGPGEAHLEWARDGEPATAKWPDLDPFGFALNLSSTDPEVEIQQCAGCHARRESLEDGNPLPGTAFHDAYRLSLLRPDLYHADGQILDEVYVYGSFLQSKMYARGVRCTDCHDPHDAQVIAEGNAVCTQCHNPEGNTDFPTLRLAEYDDPEHHFHAPGSEGAQCRNCHMIQRTYMGIDGRRDHSFRVPRPDLAAATGGPDACTDCHTDETAEWAASVLQEKFPNSAHRGPHFGQTLAAARLDPVAQEAALRDLALDDSMPVNVRATALEMLAGTENTGEIQSLLSDENPLIRAAAVNAQRGAPPQDKVQWLLPLLSDPVKSVRTSAARELLNAPIARLPDKEQAAMNKAMAEWQGALQKNADFPEAHMAIGGTALVLRRPEAAVGAFAEATRLDPQRVDAWVMQVRILAALGEEAALRATLDQALELNPDAPALLDLQAQLP